MQKIHHSIFINAPREKVWETMLGEATYRQWTAPFNEGSYFKGNWEVGSKMLFLGPNPDGSGEGGMVSMIRENRPPEFISIEHIGFYKEGVEDTTSPQVKSWTPSFENYTFMEKDGGTEVSIELDSPDEYAEMFNGMWPKALKVLKEISEN